MSARENMKQAMKELFNKTGVGLDNTGAEQNSAITGGETEHMTVKITEELPTDKAGIEKWKEDDSVTTIATGCVFTGDLSCQGKVNIRGKLNGNLETNGDVLISGQVLGDIIGDTITLTGCTVQGNITGSSLVKIDEAAVIVGDVVGGDVQMNGRVKGDMIVQKSVLLQKNAVSWAM